MSGETFPILRSWNRDEQRRLAGAPESVPWELVAPHEPQALRNHGGQTLVRLAERGGLSVGELVAVLDGKGYGDVQRDVDALPRLLEILAPRPAADPPASPKTPDEIRTHLTETVWLVAEAFGADRNCPACQKVVRHMDRREIGSVCGTHGGHR